MLVDFGDEGKVSHGLHRLSRIFFLFHLPLNMTKAVFLSLFIVVIYGCSPSKKLDAETMATNACNCFSELTEEGIDERLDACLSQPVYVNATRIYDNSGSGEAMDTVITNYMTEVIILMVHNCDRFFFEADSMYTQMYPEVDYASVEQSVLALNDSLAMDSLDESVTVSLLHRKAAMLTRARRFDSALIVLDMLANEYGRETETYLLSAYLYRSKGLYDLALGEIEKAVQMGNNGHALFGELIKRRKMEEQAK